MNAETLINQFGALGVLLAMMIVFGRWFLKRMDCEKKERAAERERERAERESMASSFHQNCEAFNVTMSNHLVHQEQAFGELVKSIERLCLLETTKRS